jgi:PAS domain S-box-containing protein
MSETAALATRFEELKRYVRFGPGDERALVQLLEQVRDEFPQIAREFYERAREHDDAHAVFENEEQIARLQRSMVAWLERVMSGPFDADYCAKSARIGAAHVTVGLPQRYVLAAMNLIRQRLHELAYERLGSAAVTAVTALSRILDIELALMTETYQEALVRRLARLNTSAGIESDRYVRAVQLATTMIIGLDPDGRIQLFNHEAERVTGFAFDEVQGERFGERFIVDDADCGFSGLWGRVAGSTDERVAVASCLLRTRAGRLRDIEGELARAPEGEHDDGLIFLVARDVTDERLLEARLLQSEKLAAVGTLAAGLAHEIRNPLNGAQLHLTFLRRALSRANDSGDMVEAIEVVESELKRLSMLVTDFLDFARPRPIRPEAVTVKQLCQRTADQVRSIAAAANCRLDLEFPDAEVELEVDAPMVEQVLANLLRNAVEAVAPTGGGEVRLRAYRQPRKAVFEVHDDGPGMGDGGAPIFDAFYSTKQEGTGLGLAIVHRVVSDHGGSIQVESEPGHTMFRVVLPISSVAPRSSRLPRGASP